MGFTDSGLWLWLAAGYLLGSVPFGLLIGYLFGAGDIRRSGSGNIGATNVLRCVGKFPAALALLGDSGKGALAVALIYIFGNNGDFNNGDLAAWVALASVIGHNFPLWLRFKGGKGVAVSMGALAVADIWLGVTLAVVWLAVFACFRISSLAALAAFAVLPMAAVLIEGGGLLLSACLLLSLLIFVRHGDNIRRLIKGTEKPIDLRGVGGGVGGGFGKK